MNILVITVAGLSSRFSRSLGRTALKCIYHEKDLRESLLYRMLNQPVRFDRYIIVGGFLFEELAAALAQPAFASFRERILLVKNEQYAEYGSGYSLYKGLKAAQNLPFQTLVFAEGDLYTDSESFKRVCAAEKNVITCTREPILASSAVAFYYDTAYGIHYIYDTSHSALTIAEPFAGIFNSGQIWKFAQPERLRSVMAEMTDRDWRGTNLELIQRYFGGLSETEYDRIELKEWINCNTVADYKRITG